MNIKTLGASLIVGGTAIGAGMLALPIQTAPLGISETVLFMLAMWAIMTFGALLTLEVNLAFKAPNHSFGTMAGKLLGPIGQTLTVFCLLALLYALTGAYTTGGAQMIKVISESLFSFHLSDAIAAILFIIILGGIIVHSTQSVDKINRVLFSIKIFLFIALATTLIPDMHISFWQPVAASIPLSTMFTVILTSFGFNVVVPSVSEYLKKDVRQLRIAFILGSLLPLLVYFIWIAFSRGIIPPFGEQSFTAIANAENSLPMFISLLDQYGSHGWAQGITNIFANLALATSFLGVALSLFDFLNDKCPGNGSSSARGLAIGLCTFVPPLLFALFFPQGFTYALKYAGIFVLILCLLMPAWMALKLRQHPTLKSPYQVAGGALPVWAVLVFSSIALIWAVWEEWHIWGMVMLITLFGSIAWTAKLHPRQSLHAR